MKIQIVSDLHLDFHKDHGAKFIASMNPIGVDTLVIAGDIAEVGDGERYYNMLKAICDKYPEVVMVSGNHEFYRNGYDEVEHFRMKCNYTISNLHWLENERYGRFIGCTLWFRDDPRSIFHERKLSDFKLINGFKDFVYDVNDESRRYLTENTRHNDIIITHHLPSVRSVSQRFRNDPTNAFFVCEMDIESLTENLWIHGHTHDPCDWFGGHTRVICNPLGYPSERNGYDEKLAVEV